ncbi:hypothetical protein HCZ23_07255 [Celeribacter sp. HF31]|uniref:hypothetical protein n=1 Tax=Celeribacter sp. HF31 TaxID=2721558 RepID=UPI001431B194|nr:hypothetical protein [Celeribacter sp. HF31]NIY79264.1 hypothetical protein [Celeribacter sp. HF31]
MRSSVSLDPFLNLPAAQRRCRVIGAIGPEEATLKTLAEDDGLRESGAGGAFVKGHDPEVWMTALRSQMNVKHRVIAPAPDPSDLGPDWCKTLQSLVVPSLKAELQGHAA